MVSKEQAFVKDLSDVSEMLDQVLNYYGAEISHDLNPMRSYDMMFYEETTADGYSIYIATSDRSDIYMNEEVYMYESDRYEKLSRCIEKGYHIYIEEYEMGNYEIASIIEDLYKKTQSIIENDKEK